MICKRTYKFLLSAKSSYRAHKTTEISRRIAAEWYSSAALIVYSIVMTVVFIILHWDTVLTGGIFFTRFVGVIKGIWEVAWPAVYNYWFRQLKANPGSLIATIVTAVLFGGAVFGMVVLFRQWKRCVDNSYEEKDRRKVEINVLITLAALVLSLIICSHTDIEMSWIMLWILIAVGTDLSFQTLRLILIRKDRRHHKR